MSRLTIIKQTPLPAFHVYIFWVSLPFTLSLRHTQWIQKTNKISGNSSTSINLSNFFYNQHFLSFFFFFFQSLPCGSPLIFGILGFLSHTSNIKNSWFFYEFIIMYFLLFMLIRTQQFVDSMLDLLAWSWDLF